MFNLPQFILSLFGFNPNKNNLEYAKNKFIGKFDNTFFPAILLKDLVISNETYKNICNDKNSKNNFFLQKQIYKNLLKTLQEINTLLQIVNLKQKEQDPFAYNIQINLSNYDRGYISFIINPFHELTKEQQNLLYKNIIKEIFLISPLLSSTRAFLSESNKLKNIYSHMNEDEAIEYMHHKISEQVNDFFSSNKKNIFMKK